MDNLTSYFKDHEAKGIPASLKRQYEVTAADLPLCCPMPDMRLWDAHPRVYLPIQTLGTVICPYCDAEYRLVHE
ncbi:MAG: hypothetical protein ACD_44C00036G0009 [uncultured bacterium]|nr:MAG: hypothetical protein ACD_44C00036G0009 [uncultured bacterium]OGT15939.1 MAG: hypothetical protein A3B69_02315 [Gammaproteobacteria bacterium RIFCSPHIGHO2_02_FULL_38_33]OGT24480.1 MAG: hypothetical protein A2W47_03465 [Gammaproteobacteria bacterium RIFCSPHIGHO2_12_38_15]OGT69071.1 MAG: hypothetical protein A3I12_05840 [Gammaproteobacteria bacterium RIFCSPLOWO2_02_FULL_38_11]OGT77645.1 MAG: hypothetical protein A3G71_02000 [Gammaproteobacteria bacterium RIFCSPLOWO2_12_FULL_38_14]